MVYYITSTSICQVLKQIFKQKGGTVMEKLTMNVNELAQTLGISLSKAYQLVRQSDFPSVHLGGRWIVPVAALEDWLMKQAQNERRS